MKRSVLFVLVAFATSVSIFSQPGHENGFIYYKDIVFSAENNQTLMLDLYLPQAVRLSSGIGVAGTAQKQDSTKEIMGSAYPLIIWIGKAGTDKFPSPVASYVGNGYAVVSLPAKQPSEILKNADLAIGYLQAHSTKFNLDTKKTGIILCSSKGYKALIIQNGLLKSGSIDTAEIQLQILADKDTDYSALQSPENISKILGFFDNYLMNGHHKESDPLKLTCPVDSWADPITHPIPG